MKQDQLQKYLIVDRMSLKVIVFLTLQDLSYHLHLFQAHPRLRVNIDDLQVVSIMASF